MFIPAMAARQFLPRLADAGRCIPCSARDCCRPGMLGLMIAAMFSATMSNLSSHYSVLANVLTIDVYRRLLRPQASQRELVAVVG